jgi:hypothetical protein
MWKPLLFLVLVNINLYAETIEKNSDQKCLEGQLKECIISGKNYSQNNNLIEGLKFYKLACDGNEFMGCTLMGALYYKEGKKAESIQFLNKACNGKENNACELVKKMSLNHVEDKSNSTLSLTPRQLTLELLKVQKIDEAYNNYLVLVSNMYILNMENKMKAPLSEDLKNEVKKIFSAEVKLQSILDNLTQLFESQFTPNEMLEILNFYKTPTGQKYLSASQTIMQQTLIILKEAIDKSQNNIDKNVKKSLESKSNYQFTN